LETAKLKKGVSPGFCPLQQSHVAGWKKRARSNWLNGGTEATSGVGQPQQPQAGSKASPKPCAPKIIGPPKKGNKMNLYLISQDVNNGYDTYDSAVVSAVSEDAARSIHPGEHDWDGKAEMYGPWCAKENVTVRLIGTAADDVSGVVCASFNAG